MSRFAFGFAFVTGSLLAIGACGGDDDKTCDTIDASGSGSDAGSGSGSDAHVDPAVTFNSDEGGEVRLEWIKFPNGNTGARGTAFFYSDPGTTKYWDFLSLDGCTDLTGSNGQGKWPKAQNANRTYFDVGNYVVASGASPAQAPLVFPRVVATTPPAPAAPGRDPVGRAQPINSWYFNAAGPTDMDGDSLLPSDTFYDITLPGSANYAGHTYENAVYIPGDMTPDMPPYNGTAIIVPATGDMTFTFTNATSHPPVGPDGTALEVQNLIAFTANGVNPSTDASDPDGQTFGPAVICIKKQQAGGTTTVTVPAAMLAVVKAAYGNGGQLARQTVIHNVKELYDGAGAGTHRRVDFIGVWCYAGQGFTFPVPN
ncbi:MAG TPA: hypothetical protein VGM39_07470 [Kofleriaceae bacterium]